MALIRDYAAFACESVKLQGSTSSLDISADAKAKLNGVVKKIADLGVEGATKYKSSEFEGLLQSDLAKALSDQSNCRLSVLKELKDKLLPNAPPTAPTAPAKSSSTLEELWKFAFSDFRSRKPFVFGESRAKVEDAIKTETQAIVAHSGKDLLIVDVKHEQFRSVHSYVFRFDDSGKKLRSIRLSREFKSELPYALFVDRTADEYKEESARDSAGRRLECEQFERMEVFAKATFGPPVQELKQYSATRIGRAPDRRFVGKKAFLMFYADGSYVIFAREVSKVIFDPGNTFQPNERILFNAQGDDLRCILDLHFGIGKADGSSDYTRVTADFGGDMKNLN